MKPNLNGNENGINETPNELKKKEWKNTGEKWVRSCPECKTDIVYANKWYYESCCKLNRLCKVCSKKGSRNGFFGKHISEESKNKIREKYRQKNPSDFYWFGKNLSEETKNKLRENRKRNPIKKTKEQLKTHSLSMAGNQFRKGIPHTEETKLLLRSKMVEKIRQEKGIISPNYNKTSCLYFEWLNKWNGWNGQYALNGGERYIKELGYWINYYEANHNVVVEWDEKRHYNPNGLLKKEDVRRMNRIKKHLNCRFFRYNEKTKELKEYE
jgi:hypothetical protein